MIKDLPHSIDSEHGLLGGLIKSEGKTESFINALEELTAESFYESVNGKIFNRIKQAYSANNPITLATVADGLQTSEREALVEIIRNNGVVANISYYAKVVREKSYERVLHDKFLMASNAVIEEGEHQGKVDRAMGIISKVDERVEDNSAYVSELMEAYLEELDMRFNSGGKIIGFETGFSDLDERLQGLRGGDLVIVAGRPSMGKTVMAMNIAENCAMKGGHVKVFSMEMPKKQLIERMIASVGRVELKKLKTGQLDPQDWTNHNRGFGLVNEMQVNIDDRGGLNINQIKASARKANRIKKLDLIAIDYIQLMSGTSNSNGRVAEITEITMGLKALAKELDIPIIALSQLSRKVEERPNKRPLMSDLRDSGSIEQDADVIIMMYRDEYYDEASQYKGIAEANVVKNRSGENGKVYLASNLQYTRFDNFSGDIPAETVTNKKQSRWA